MESDILNNLETIKILLWIIVVFSFVSTCILIFGVIGRNLQSKEIITNNLFRSEALKLQDQGDFQGLVELAQDRLENYPKDLNAMFSLGIGYLRQKKYPDALNAFSDIKTIDPHWESKSIEDYIDKIRGAMDGPKRNET